MNVRVMIGSSAVCAMVVAAVSVAPRAQTETLALTHVSVVDVLTGQLQPNSTVTISGQTIRSIVANGAVPSGARVLDGQGRYLIPGMWDMHAHMEATGASWLQLYVANGVTGIRDMGSQVDLILKMREDTAAGRVLGPRIFAAGPILDDAPGDWPFRLRVKTAADGRAAVQMLKGRGVDLIKVHDHTPADAFFAIADEARRQNLPLAGHKPLGLTIEQVVDAGQGDIEHLDNTELWKPCSGGEAYRPEGCRSFFAMLAQKGIWQTPTMAAFGELGSIGTPASLIPADRMAYAGRSLRAMWAGNQGTFVTPDVIRQMRAAVEVAARVTTDMAKAGVPILAGCDTMIAGFCVHDELAVMVRGGMTPLAALQTATINPARYFKLQQTAGSVSAGRRADLVLLDGNPLSDIANVGRIRAVVLGGRLLERSDLDRLLDQVRAAAQ
jgi:imidazolonepropionase-like amidohydrolase